MSSPRVIERGIRLQGGAVGVSHGGIDTWGLLETPPAQQDVYDAAQTSLMKPSVVVANGILAGIGADPLDGVRGKGEVVTITREDVDGETQELSFVVTEVTSADPDGGLVRLELGHQN